MKRQVLGAAVAVAVLAGSGAFAGDAFAEANGRASCIGIEASEISPPGSSEELPGGARQLASELRSFATSLGVPPGALFSGFARLHEGSHEACDEAVE